MTNSNSALKRRPSRGTVTTCCSRQRTKRGSFARLRPNFSCKRARNWWFVRNAARSLTKIGRNEQRVAISMEDFARSDEIFVAGCYELVESTEFVLRGAKFSCVVTKFSCAAAPICSFAPNFRVLHQIFVRCTKSQLRAASFWSCAPNPRRRTKSLLRATKSCSIAPRGSSRTADRRSKAPSHRTEVDAAADFGPPLVTILHVRS